MKKILSFTLCLTLIMCAFNFPTNSYALEATNNAESNITSTSEYGTFSGLIITDESVDLSNIEVKVYSKELAYSEDGIKYYGGNYLYSVFTNSNGIFTFEKPSEYCSYTIELSTLPADFGLTEFSVDIEPTEYNGNINISKIASIGTYLDSVDVKAEFYDQDGNTLFVDYVAITDTYRNATSTKRETLGSVYANYNTVKSMQTFNFTGTIETSGASYRYSEQYDTTTLTPRQKIDLLYSTGEINEDEKYSLYADYLNEDAIYYNDCIGALSCGTSNYYSNTRSTNDYDFTNRPSCTLTEPRQIRNNFTINIHYDDAFLNTLNSFDINTDNLNNNDFDSEEFFDNISNSIEDLLSNLNYAIYPTTLSTTGNTLSYDIYLTTGGTNNNTLTFGQAIPETDAQNNGTGNSYMIIYYDFILALLRSGNFSEAAIEKSQIFLYKGAAHEFTHSILFKHGLFNNLWAHEGFSAAIEFITGKYTDYSLKGIADSYIQNPQFSITSFNGSDAPTYGAMLLFLCLYDKFGGWDAINAFLNNLYMIKHEFYNIYTGTAPIFKALTFIYNGTTYDYIDVFAKMATCNYDSNKIYDLNWIEKPYEGMIFPKWSTAPTHEVNINTTMYNFTLSPISFDYFKFVNNTSNTYNVKCKIEITDRVDTFTFAVLSETSSGGIRLGNRFIRDYDNLTILVESLGENNYKSYVMIPINVHLTGTPINYWVRSTTY